MHRRQLADYIALAVIWGMSFVLVLHVVAAFGWIGAVAFRALIASVILLVMARATGRVLRLRKSGVVLSANDPTLGDSEAEWRQRGPMRQTPTGG